MSTPVTRSQVLAVVAEARRRGVRADLSGSNLSKVDLSGSNLYRADLYRADLSESNLSMVNLSMVNLYGSNLSESNLSGSNLSESNLSESNLSESNLYRADLSSANLYRAALSGSNLYGSNLYGANLYGANLSGADFSGSNLYGARGGILAVDGLPSGRAILRPLVTGWSLDIGCWLGHTVDELRTLVAGADWPEAEGDEQDRRRPGLLALADLCDAHIASHADDLAAVVEHWGGRS